MSVYCLERERLLKTAQSRPLAPNTNEIGGSEPYIFTRCCWMLWLWCLMKREQKGSLQEMTQITWNLLIPSFPSDYTLWTVRSTGSMQCWWRRGTQAETSFRLDARSHCNHLNIITISVCFCVGITSPYAHSRPQLRDSLLFVGHIIKV